MATDDKYTYPGSGGVLKNKLGITSGLLLDRAMNDYATAAWAQLAMREVEKPDFRYLQNVHRGMFGKLFTWAGSMRDVDVAAGNTGIVYARPFAIGHASDDLFSTLEAEGYLAGINDAEDFYQKLADRWGYLTQIHPFRDGNTRSQSFFISQLSALAGYPIDWQRVDVDQLRNARLLSVVRAADKLAEVLHHASLHKVLAHDFGDSISFTGGTTHTSGVAAESTVEIQCGKWMPRAKAQCILKSGHGGHCRSQPRRRG